jgi:hypothetical protein
MAMPDHIADPSAVLLVLQEVGVHLAVPDNVPAFVAFTTHPRVYPVVHKTPMSPMFTAVATAVFTR